MKIGLVTSEALGTGLGTATTILGLATSLSNLGHDVHILAPNQATTKVQPNLTFHGYGGPFSSLFQSLTRRAYESPRFASKTVLRPRVLRAAVKSLERYVVKWANRLSLDILEGHQELASSACVSAGKRLSASCVSRFHNVWFEECLELRLLTEKQLAFQFLKELTSSILEKSDSIITPTPYMKDYFQTRLSAPKSSRIFSVWPGARPQTSLIERDASTRRVVYSGSLNQLEGLRLYFEAASLTSSEFDISICGKGDRHAVTDLAHAFGRTVQLCWFDSRTQYLQYLANCILGVVPWGPSQSRRLGFPMKLLDYISVGLPVVASRIGSWSDFVEKLGFGIVSEPNGQAWAESFNGIMTNEPSLQSMREKAWEASKTTFSWDNAIAKIDAIYRELA